MRNVTETKITSTNYFDSKSRKKNYSLSNPAKYFITLGLASPKESWLSTRKKFDIENVLVSITFAFSHFYI